MEKRESTLLISFNCRSLRSFL